MNYEEAFKQWRSVPGNHVRLSQILTDPVFVSAMQIIEGGSEVETPDLIGRTPLSPEGIVRKTAVRAGVRSVLPSLQKLLQPKVERVQELGPWDHFTSTTTDEPA